MPLRLVPAVAAATLLVACAVQPAQLSPTVATPNQQLAVSGTSPAKPGVTDSTGIHKIQHVVIIMQENHSFDNYFGTFPGADGIPRDKHGNLKVCIPAHNAGH